VETSQNSADAPRNRNPVQTKNQH